MTSVEFDQPGLAKVVATLTAEEIDALPFGVVRLDPDGKVILFSEAEARQSGFGSRPRIGLTFFTQIAPCMNTESFRGRAERAIKAGVLDVEFSHIGDFNDADRELTVKIQSAADGGMWIFLRREN